MNGLASFYRGRKVLVTGHTGFKGSWLTVWLSELGADVVGFSDREPDERGCFGAQGLDGIGEHHIGDVRDLEALRAVALRAQPDVVFHLAGQAIVDNATLDPATTFGTNVLGTVHMLEVIRAVESVRAAVLVTSDKCYRNREWVWPYRENDELGGDEAYSASKAAADIAIAPYLRTEFRQALRPPMTAQLAIARAGNVIGGGDWSPRRLVPDVIRAAIAGEPVRLRKADACRPWQHVLEPLNGYLLLAMRLASAGGDELRSAWNFGPPPGAPVTVLDVACKLVECLEADIPIELHDDGDGEQRTLRVDTTKANTYLGWHSVLSIDEGVTMTAEWVEAWRHGKDPRDVCRNQIAEYSRMASERGLAWLA